MAMSMFENDCGSAKKEHNFKHMYGNVNACNSASGQFASHEASYFFSKEVLVLWIVIVRTHVCIRIRIYIHIQL
jgi:hypothetical protein